MSFTISEKTGGEIELISILLCSHNESGSDALNWLKTPHDSFEGLPPLEFISRYPDQAELVRRYLEKTLHSERVVS